MTQRVRHMCIARVRASLTSAAGTSESTRIPLIRPATLRSQLHLWEVCSVPSFQLATRVAASDGPWRSHRRLRGHYFVAHNSLDLGTAEIERFTMWNKLTPCCSKNCSSEVRLWPVPGHEAGAHHVPSTPAEQQFQCSSISRVTKRSLYKAELRRAIISQKSAGLA